MSCAYDGMTNWAAERREAAAAAVQRLLRGGMYSSGVGCLGGTLFGQGVKRRREERIASKVIRVVGEASGRSRPPRGMPTDHPSPVAKPPQRHPRGSSDAPGVEPIRSKSRPCPELAGRHCLRL